MKTSAKTCWIFVLTACLFTAAGHAAETTDSIADVNIQSSLITWTPFLNEATGLTVSGPAGVQSFDFEAGEAPSLGLVDETGTLRPDGSYTYRLVALPKLDSTKTGPSADGRSQGMAPAERLQGLSQSGSFTIRGGVFVDPWKTEEAQQGASKANKDQFIADDLIVDGSSCIGFDCENGESFGFDTLRLKENNLRLHFEDTSGNGSFPGNDWRIILNDSSNGGLNHFSIEDATIGRSPFTIEAGASRNSLYIDDSGRVGVGTATPATELHVTDGDSPALRLEQDGSSGFSSQTWDVAGNEANFFVRDLTNDSKIPFRIKPDAPNDSIYIKSDGNIGFGTDNPSNALHVKRNDGTASVLVDEATTTAGIYTLLDLKTSGPVGTDLRPRFTITHGGQNASWNFDILNNGNFAFIRGGGGSVFTFTSTGDLRIEGDFISDGTSLNVPDYVFADDYHLMPLDDVKAFIETESHLPHVPSASEIVGSNFNLTDMQLTLLRKVEELTLYTLDQHDTIQQHQQSIDQQQRTIADYQQTLEDHRLLIADQQEIIQELRARLAL